MKLARLEEFRQAAYQYLGRAHDATFELTDAILLTRNVYCLAELSLSPVFLWPQPEKLMQLYIKQIPTVERPLSIGRRSYKLVTTRCSDTTRKNL